MKKITILLLIVFVTTVAIAQPPAGNANPGDWYGEKITAANAISIAEAAAKLNIDTATIETKIIATVLDVCPKKGCWMKLAINDSTTAFVKMKDYGFFVPVATIGKTVVIDGAIKIKTTSVAELQHYAEDAKKTKAQIAAITKPEKEIRILAKGIAVVK